MFDLKAIQSATRENKVDGSLLYDFRGLNVLACRINGMSPGAHAKRRLLNFIPANGQPK